MQGTSLSLAVHSSSWSNLILGSRTNFHRNQHKPLVIIYLLCGGGQSKNEIVLLPDRASPAKSVSCVPMGRPLGSTCRAIYNDGGRKRSSRSIGRVSFKNGEGEA